ncbi:uncharacterized protein LOC115742523 [Rhodamnia argentea]|uniref:Uncharacterized protein LOC115742523 n=1 Tax=Rhodamnia argentea TaxID=178133 RepID=A0A8B8PD54_9MYRT|nr:uncharacterized protein LOC115742523 [Rhodamnia argentea]
MMGFARPKRGSNLLDDQAKARLVRSDLRRLSSDSSGSEHDGEDDSPCLSELVHGFLEVEPEDSAANRPPADCGSDSDSDSDRAAWTDAIAGVLEEALVRNADSYRSLLLSHVSEAIEAFSCLKSDKPALRRKVMSHLREIGYNAAICKTKWDSSGGLTAGSYEFIDVVRSEPPACGSPSRYFVDVDFDGHFAIARPAPEYSRLLQRVPRVFVGGIEDLKRTVRAMCDAARRSLKSRGLSLPPWRKNRYMQNKWLAPYRRTTNPSPASTFAQAAAASSSSAGTAVKCRSVGFDQPLSGRLFVRTR